MSQEAVPHQPVMVGEVLTALQPAADGIFIDCTYGRGGHSRALLQALGSNGKVIALDRDPSAVQAGLAYAAEEPRLRVVRARFSALHTVADDLDVTGKVNGVLFDLGVSSPQLGETGRGFGFQSDGPLDMRMDYEEGRTAAEWIARAGAEEIADVLWRFGDERHSRRIARAICRARRAQAINTTGDLARIVESAIPRPGGGTRRRGRPGKHPATRTFQAIRIFINDEIRELQSALGHAVNVLAPGGRLAAISFHSLEDRTVKRFMRDLARGATRGVKAVNAPGAKLRVIGRPLRPTDAEIRRNPRSRSAVLRVAEKLA